MTNEEIVNVLRSIKIGMSRTEREALEGAINALEKEQTGKWEEIVQEHKCYARDDTYTTTEYHCSECGAEPFENEDGFYELSNYCPYCGSAMKGE